MTRDELRKEYPDLTDFCEMCETKFEEIELPHLRKFLGNNYSNVTFKGCKKCNEN